MPLTIMIASSDNMVRQINRTIISRICILTPDSLIKLRLEILDRVYVGYSFGLGFPGDADNEEQSGWYLMTMLGFYPFSSGTDGYITTSPMHEKTTLDLPSGTIEIISHNNSDENVYIQSMTIDGVPYDEADYTAASWAAFSAMLEKAQTYLANSDATQKQIDDMYTNLTVAKLLLIPKTSSGVDKTILEVVVGA